jgi:hypothetical protein
MGLSIYVTISWETSDVDAEVKADALIEKVKSSSGLASLFTTLPVPAPFDNVLLDTSLEPLTIDMYVSSTIHSLVTTYNSGTDDTDIEIKTVGLYDHIGVKINTEDDNKYRRLRTNGVKTVNIVGVDPSEDVIIVTLFDKDYKKLYTFIQTPSSYIQQTQGTSGDLLNEAVDGSITLDLNYDDFTTESQTDFINTMNSETGGYTIIINVYQGSAIVEYRVIFDASKTQQEIDDVVAKLSDDVEIQNIINKSKTMNNIVASKTINKTTKREQQLTKHAKIIDVKYNKAISKIIFKTVGSYKHILYKATGQEPFLSTTNKTVDLPPDFTNKVDVKLVDINDGDITTVATYEFDIISPVITLVGDAEMTLNLGGEAYVEQGVTVTDNSGESITPVITGTVDTNTVGTYTITYTATDSSGNTASIQRVVVIDTVPSQIGVLAHYENNQPFGNVVVDKTGSYDLTFDNSNYSWVIDTINGVSRYVLRVYGARASASVSGFPSIGPRTIVTWFKPDESPGNGPFSYGSEGPNNAFYVYCPGSQIVLDYWSVDEGVNPIVENRQSRWYHIAAAWDGTNNIVWLDGVRVKVGAPSELPTTNGNGIISMGSNPNTISPAYFYGNIADCLIYDRALSDAEVSRIYNYADFADTIAPVITLVGDSEITLFVGNAYVEQGATVTDNSGESITPVITGAVDVNTVGLYTITYKATDSNGNIASVNRVVNVVSNSNVLVVPYVTENIADGFYRANYYKEFSNGDMLFKHANFTISQSKLSTLDRNGPWSIVFKSVLLESFTDYRFGFGGTYETDINGDAAQQTLPNIGFSIQIWGSRVFNGFPTLSSPDGGWESLFASFLNDFYTVIKRVGSNITVTFYDSNQIELWSVTSNAFTYIDNDRMAFTWFVHNCLTRFYAGILVQADSNATINDWITAFP